MTPVEVEGKCETKSATITPVTIQPERLQVALTRLTFKVHPQRKNSAFAPRVCSFLGRMRPFCILVITGLVLQTPFIQTPYMPSLFSL